MARITPTRILPTDGEAGLNPRKILDRLEDCWDEPSPPEHLARNDLEHLQGSWVSVSGGAEVVFFISGSRYTARFSDGAIYMGTFELMAATHPKTMEMQIEEGPARYKGQVALCLYELNGNMLRWCTAGPGQKEVLVGFPREDQTHVLSFCFRRQQQL